MNSWIEKHKAEAKAREARVRRFRLKQAITRKWIGLQEAAQYLVDKECRRRRRSDRTDLMLVAYERFHEAILRGDFVSRADRDMLLFLPLNSEPSRLSRDFLEDRYRAYKNAPDHVATVWIAHCWVPGAMLKRTFMIDRFVWPRSFNPVRTRKKAIVTPKHGVVVPMRRRVH